MNNKEDLKKQVIVLSFALVFVIVVAIILNTGISKNNKNNISTQDIRTEITNTTNNTNQKELTGEEKMKENLKGLLEEPDEDYYLYEELNDKNETVVTTKSGETIIIKN